MKEKSYEQVLEEFNDVDKVNNPSHYNGNSDLKPSKSLRILLLD